MLSMAKIQEVHGDGKPGIGAANDEDSKRTDLFSGHTATGDEQRSEEQRSECQTERQTEEQNERMRQ